MKTKSTVANEAEKDIASIMGHETRTYKPWQLADHKLENVRLKTTVDEIKLIMDEPIRFREGFDVDETTVNVPNLVAKFQYNEEQLVRTFSARSKKQPGKYMLINGFNRLEKFRREPVRVKDVVHVMSSGYLNEGLFLSSKLNQFKFMKVSYQKNFVAAVNKLLSRAGEYFAPGFRMDRHALVAALLNVDPRWMDMYHHFDYQYDNPKALIYDNGTSEISSKAAVRIALLIVLGFDVFFVAPSGYASIENILNPDLYDVFYPETSGAKAHTQKSLPRSREAHGKFWGCLMAILAPLILVALALLGFMLDIVDTFFDFLL